MRAERLLLHRLLEAQIGLATRSQLHLLGMTDAQIRHFRNSGVLISMGPGVFRGAGVPSSWLLRLAASALFLDGRAIVCQASAARLHELPGFERDDTVEFARVIDSRGIGGRVTVHSARRLDDVDRCTVPLPDWGTQPVPREFRRAGVLRSVPATTPTRTIIDLAHRLPVPRLARLVDSAVSLRKATPHLLAERLDDIRDSGVSGVRRMDQVLIDAGVESWLERKFLELIREGGLPRPRCQVVFREGTRTVARVDFYFEGTRIVVEVSGRRGHVTDAERRKDARRRNDLQRAGMTVIEFVTSDIVDEPQYVVRTLRHALRLAS